MRTFILNGMEDAANIKEGDIDSPQHDTGGLSGRKFVRSKGFHRGILGGSARFPGKWATPAQGLRPTTVLVTVAVLGRSRRWLSPSNGFQSKPPPPSHLRR